MKILKIILVTINLIALVILTVIVVNDDKFSNSIITKLGLNKGIITKDELVYINNVNPNYLKEANNHIYSDDSYEEEIINNDNKLYKLIEKTIDGIEAHILVVYDASKLKMMVGKGFNTIDNSGKERITEMTKRYNAVAGINGGGFFDDGKVSKDIPIGYVIKDNKILWDYSYERRSLIIGFSNDNKLMMLDKTTGKEAIEQGMRDGLEFGPILIKNGVITKESVESKWERRAARLILSQRDDGIVIILATNGGTSGGARMSKLLEELMRYGVTNAANLDGGASTQMVVEDKLITKTKNAYNQDIPLGRLVINGWGLIP